MDVQHRRTHVGDLGTSGTHPTATIGRLRIQLSRALTIRRQFDIGVDKNDMFSMRYRYAPIQQATGR